MSRIWHVAGQGPVGGEDQLLTAAGRALIDDVDAAAQRATLGLDADIGTFALPANTTISAAGKSLIDDANAADQLETLGLTASAAELNQLDGKTITAAGAALLDDASATVQIATLGLDADIATLALPANTTITAAGAAILDDANAAAQLVTLGLTPLAAELNYVDGVTSAIQTQLDDKALLGKFSRMTVIENDCEGYQQTASFAPFRIVSINTGTVQNNVLNASPNHPGLIQFKSSTTPDSGDYLAGNSSLILGGGETFEIIFMVMTTSGTTIRMGFHNSVSVTAPTDGVYLQIVETTLTGVARNNNSETDTADTPTIVQGTWYRAKIVLNADASLATFTLFTCADGQPVTWVNNTVVTNIPTARVSGYCPLNATNSGTTATVLTDLDWYCFACPTRVLDR